MGSGKIDEAQHREWNRAYELGEQNVQHIQYARAWCKHLKVEMVSKGMLADVSGLPIGSHRLSCKHAEGMPESMNLPWILPQFLLNHCDGCPHHDANGDPTWGRTVIQQHHENKTRQAQQLREKKENLRLSRQQIRDALRHAKQSSNADTHQVLAFLEGMFSDTKDERDKSHALLIESARLAPDLFPPAAIDILIQQAPTKDFGASCLSVCAQLANRRTDLAAQLTGAARTALAMRLHQAHAAKVLLSVDVPDNCDLNKADIHSLITFQNYIRPIGGPAPNERLYKPAITLLARAYDHFPQTVQSVFKSLLATHNAATRCNVAAVLQSLQRLKPQLGFNLVKALIDSLDLPDEVHFGSADGRVRSCITESFLLAPAIVDDALAAAIPNKRQAVQEQIVQVYEHVLSQRRRGRQKDERVADHTAACTIALRRCIAYLHNDSLDITVRHEACEALETACRDHPDYVMPSFDFLIGHFALLCQQPHAPPERPRIVIPGAEDNEDPRVKSLETLKRNQEWHFFKTKILDCLKQLSESSASTVVPSLSRTYQALPTRTNEEFKGALAVLLGHAGKEYSLTPHVLPIIMTALMDYDSQWVRAMGIKAIEEVYGSSASSPPRDVVDVILIHLRDTFVVVHQAAIKILQWNSRWLSDGQARDALIALRVLIAVYKDKPYDLDDICEATLRIGRRFKAYWPFALEACLSALPTGERLIDQKMCDELMRRTDDGDYGFNKVNRLLVHCLTRYRRDPYNGYESTSRDQAFAWLRRVPAAAYAELRQDLIDSCRSVAARDAWEALHFAELFTERNDFAAEQVVFHASAEGVGDEPRATGFRELIHDLASVSMANTCLQAGNIEAAERAIGGIVGARKDA